MTARLATTVAVSALTVAATLGVASPAFAGNPHGNPPGQGSPAGKGQVQQESQVQHPSSAGAHTANENADGNAKAGGGADVQANGGLSPQGATHAGATGNPTPGTRYPVCHATGSATNPYVSIRVALPAVVNGHHHHHAQHDPDDIIPAIRGHYAGLNASAYDGACASTTGDPAARGVPQNPGTPGIPESPGTPGSPGTPQTPADLQLPTLSVDTLPATGDDSTGLYTAAGLGLLALGAAAFAAARWGRRREAEGEVTE